MKGAMMAEGTSEGSEFLDNTDEHIDMAGQLEKLREENSDKSESEQATRVKALRELAKIYPVAPDEAVIAAKIAEIKARENDPEEREVA